jgi:hypothetical protein
MEKLFQEKKFEEREETKTDLKSEPSGLTEEPEGKSST